MIHGDQSVGYGGDDSVSCTTDCSGNVEAGEAAGVEDSDRHGQGEESQTQLI